MCRIGFTLGVLSEKTPSNSSIFPLTLESTLRQLSSYTGAFVRVRKLHRVRLGFSYRYCIIEKLFLSLGNFLGLWTGGIKLK